MDTSGPPASDDEFFAAVRRGQVHQVRDEIQSGRHTVNETDRLSWTPLHYAAMLGNVKLAEMLIELGADVNMQNGDGYTPLHWAVLNHHERLCSLLREKGADPEIPDKFGEHPLQLSPMKLKKVLQPTYTPPPSPEAPRHRPRSTSTSSYSARTRPDGILLKSAMPFSPLATKDDMAIPSPGSSPSSSPVDFRMRSRIPRPPSIEGAPVAAADGPTDPWYHWRSLYALGKKPMLMKIIQILFQVILCLLLEMLQEQAKRFFQLVVLLAPGQLYFIVLPLSYLTQVFRPIWVNLFEPILRPFLLFLFNPLKSLFSAVFVALGGALMGVFNALIAPFLQTIWATLGALLSPLWQQLLAPLIQLGQVYLMAPLWALSGVFSQHWGHVSALLMAKIRENLVPKQLLYNIFYPLVNGLRLLLLKYMDWFPLPVTQLTARLAYLVFGIASAEETALMLILSFTLTSYGTVILAAYLYKLGVLLTGLLVSRLAGPGAVSALLPSGYHSGWRPDLEHHQLGATLLLSAVCFMLLVSLLRLIPSGLRLLGSACSAIVRRLSRPRRPRASSDSTAAAVHVSPAGEKQD